MIEDCLNWVDQFKTLISQPTISRQDLEIAIELYFKGYSPMGAYGYFRAVGWHK